MLHQYRAVTVLQHHDAEGPKEEWLETREWPAASLTAHMWKNTLLYSLQFFGPEIVSRDGRIECTLFRDDSEIGKLFFTTWYSSLDQCRKYAFLYKDKAHGLYTIRVFKED